MRPLKTGDLIRLTENVATLSTNGTRRQYEAGDEFEVVEVCEAGADRLGLAKRGGRLADERIVLARDGTGQRVPLRPWVCEFVRAGHNPPDDPPTGGGNDGDHTGGGPVGVARSRLGKRRGLVRVPEAA